MPHIIVEFSANLVPLINIDELLHELHEAALQSGVFPLGGLRTRAHRCDNYQIADRHADNLFIHVALRIGHGRDDATKRRAGESIFAALTRFIEPVYASSPIGLSLEVQEIDPAFSFKKNNLHDYVAERTNGADSSS